MTRVMLDTGNTAWMLMSSAMVMLMTPGLGFFHAGLTGAKNTTNTMLMCMMSMALVTIQWVLVGYSFSFSKGNSTYGSFHSAALRHIGTDISDTYGSGIPNMIFVAFQNMFAQLTPALISGAVLGRMNFLAYILFVFIWSLGVYNPITHWCWALIREGNVVKPLGWLLDLGALDFAGGNVIHIASGFSALAVSLVLGKKNKNDFMPNNMMLALGTSLLWFGWFGFNAGSQLAADGVAALAFINTHISACIGLLTWVVLDAVRTKQVTAYSVACGAIAGLVCVTPGCGYVDPMTSFLYGTIGSFLSWATLQLTHHLNYDLEAFAIHGVAGVAGAWITGLHSNKQWNPAIKDGSYFGHSKQLGYQIAGIVSIGAFAAFASLAIMLLLKYTIGIKMSEEQKVIGADVSFHGGGVIPPKPLPPQEVLEMSPLPSQV